MTVHGPGELDEHANYGSREAMESAFAATEAFNDELRAEGYWVFAGAWSRRGRRPSSTVSARSR